MAFNILNNLAFTAFSAAQISCSNIKVFFSPIHGCSLISPQRCGEFLYYFHIITCNFSLFQTFVAWQVPNHLPWFNWLYAFSDSPGRFGRREAHLLASTSFYIHITYSLSYTPLESLACTPYFSTHLWMPQGQRPYLLISIPSPSQYSSTVS